MKKNLAFFIAATGILSCILQTPFSYAEQSTQSLPVKPKTERLKVLTQLEESAKELGADMLMNQTTFIGDSAKAAKIFSQQTGPISGGRDRSIDITPYLKSVDESKSENAIQAIVREAQSRQIVMINEAHHIPMHRAFSTLLARELRKIGFEYFACETCSESLWQASTAQIRYVQDIKSGYYIQDPIFANFIREMLNTNWKIVSYESPQEKGSAAERIRLRELMGAKNLVSRILEKNPKAKILIHVGYDHLNKYPESTSDDSRALLAAHLKRISGIDPLTIDQTTFYTQEGGGKSLKDIYDAINKKHKPTQPITLRNPDGQYQVLSPIPGKAVDMQIVFPAYEEVNLSTGRAGWMSNEIFGLIPYEVPKELLPKSKRRLIYAYHQEDPVDAAPADLVLVEIGKPAPKLMLPKGEYRFAFEE